MIIHAKNTTVIRILSVFTQHRFMHVIIRAGKTFTAECLLNYNGIKQSYIEHII